ncbi:MAG TPA: M24 family metallopeptidase [Candidatus Lustribacter sp.]|jgi:Xaa-Pro aminopeptidase|nr:M24 family metallopeptidase [Candidatus Lustribacter sp.]
MVPQFSLAERDRRWKAVRQLMREEHLDVIVVPNNTGHSTDFQANARWLTHVGGGGDADIAAVFPLEGDVTAIGNHPAVTFGPDVQSWTQDLRNARRDMSQGAVERLKELGVERGRIGITGLGPGTRTPMGTILLGFYQRILEAFPNAELVDATALLDRVRYVKSDEEVEVLTKSEEIIEKAIEAKIAHAVPGAVDWEVWAAVMYALLKNGSELPVHTQWVSGKSVQTPITRPTLRRLERGDLLIAEIESSYIGYRAQAYQPVFVGVADPVHVELMKLQREIWSTVCDRLRPGVTVGELVALTDRLAAERAPKSGPAAGATAILNMHGRGAGDDGPLVTPSQKRPEQLAVPLEANMVFIFKPFVRTRDGAEQCTWGDTVVVTPAGGRRLGRRPHDLAISSG